MSVKSLGFEQIKGKAYYLRGLPAIASSFSLISEADDFLRDNALAPVIGTICDEQIGAEAAWEFPFWLTVTLSIQKLDTHLMVKIGKDQIRQLLERYMQDKWPSGMKEEDRIKYLDNTSSRILEACKYINLKYKCDPDELFVTGNYRVPEIYFILRTLPGVGPKKASMIARDFAASQGNWYIGVRERLASRHISFFVEGRNLTEVPIDIHVVKVYGRLLGEFWNTPERNRFLDYVPDIQNFAKLVEPDFPARLDNIFWEVGREYCNERQPKCSDCPLQNAPCEYASSH